MRSVVWLYSFCYHIVLSQIQQKSKRCLVVCIYRVESAVRDIVGEENKQIQGRQDTM